MKKILILGMGQNQGGIENVIMNYYREIDHNKMQWDFFNVYKEKMAFEKEVLHLGGKIYYITSWKENFFLYKKELKKFFYEHKGEYDVVWINVSKLDNIDRLIIAKETGIPRRIIHSHNSNYTFSWKYKFIGKMFHKFNRLRIEQYATDFWACSTEAIKWLYPSYIYKYSTIIRNAINIENMRYDNEKREIYRLKLGWTNDFIIGNIGRLAKQKNQIFLLDVLYCLQKASQKIKLILIGDGNDEEILRQKAESLGLTKYIFFAGKQTDISGWLSAMDMFVFPSIFEGLPVAVLEAQANGLPVLISDVITSEVIVTENIVTLNLNDGCQKWANKILEMKEEKIRLPSYEILKSFRSAGYDIHYEAKRLEKFLIGKSD